MPAPVSDVLCAPWADYDDVPAVLLDALPDTVEQEDVEEALMRASEILWALSGRTWYGGGCTESAVIRSIPPMPGTGTWPYESSWGNCRCWSYGSAVDGLPARLRPFMGRHVGSPIAVRLPRSPVVAVTEVLVGGEAFAAWHLLPSGWLERTDGKPWAVCDGDTEITYEFGRPPPAGGRDAAIELALELVRYRFGLEGCRLPRRATQVVRQGVSITIDPLQFLSEGGTGLLVVDLWLRAVNPDRGTQPARVWSPDLPRTMRS